MEKRSQSPAPAGRLWLKVLHPIPAKRTEEPLGIAGTSDPVQWLTAEGLGELLADES